MLSCYRYSHFVCGNSSIKSLIYFSRKEWRINFSSGRPYPKKWNSVVLIGNKKAGSQRAECIISKFRPYLKSYQIVDISCQSPVSSLSWCCSLRDRRTLVIVAGGDGTVASVLSDICRLNLELVPEVVVLPTGTGNDLARVLGWRDICIDKIDPEKLITELRSAKQVYLDRWRIQMRLCSDFSFHANRLHCFMYNYIGIGVDAQVTLDFHQLREGYFNRYRRTNINKFLYLTSGAYEILRGPCYINPYVELYLDDKRAELPLTQSIVILNIPSWAAGVQLWNMGSGSSLFSPQCINDGKLEVVCICTLFHMAQLQLGFSEPVRIGQAYSVKLRLHKSLPIQVDGEPWEQAPSAIEIIYHDKALVLQRPRCD